MLVNSKMIWFMVKESSIKKMVIYLKVYGKIIF